MPTTQTRATNRVPRAPSERKLLAVLTLVGQWWIRRRRLCSSFLGATGQCRGRLNRFISKVNLSTPELKELVNSLHILLDSGNTRTFLLCPYIELGLSMQNIPIGLPLELSNLKHIVESHGALDRRRSHSGA